MPHRRRHRRDSIATIRFVHTGKLLDDTDGASAGIVTDLAFGVTLALPRGSAPI